MHRSALLAAISLISTLSTAGAQQRSAALKLPQHYDIDGAHSMMGFSVGFMGLSRVRGGFGTFGGTLMYDSANVEKSSVSAIILARSISTNHQGRDNHLRSPDFFEVEKYPYITFKSVAIRRAPNGFVADGDFTMHGVSKRIQLPFVQMNKPASDAWGNQRMTFQSSTRLSRKEFGIVGTAFWNNEFDPGRMAVSDDVDIELLVSATIPNPLRWTDVVGDSLLKEVEQRGVAATLEQLKAARATNPKIDSITPFSYNVVGEKLVAKGRLADAVAVYAVASELQPKNSMLAARYATSLAKMGETARAVPLLRKVLEQDPTSTQAAEWLRILAP